MLLKEELFHSDGPVECARDYTAGLNSQQIPLAEISHLGTATLECRPL